MSIKLTFDVETVEELLEAISKFQLEDATPDKVVSPVVTNPKVTFEETFEMFDHNAASDTVRFDNLWKTKQAWGRSVRVNNELQTYTHEGNFLHNDSALQMRMIRDYDGEYTSAMIMQPQIKQNGYFYQKYGTFTIRAKMPEGGKGLWPAFWLTPALDTWCKDVYPEIDIMEFIGDDPSVYYVTVHDANLDYTKLTQQGFKVETGVDLTKTFNDFGVIWSEDYCQFTFNGKIVKSIPAPKSFVWEAAMVANFAVGGNWAGDPDPSVTTADFAIQSIKVTQ